MGDCALVLDHCVRVIEWMVFGVWGSGLLDGFTEVALLALTLLYRGTKRRGSGGGRGRARGQVKE